MSQTATTLYLHASASTHPLGITLPGGALDTWSGTIGANVGSTSGDLSFVPLKSQVSKAGNTLSSTNTTDLVAQFLSCPLDAQPQIAAANWTIGVGFNAGGTTGAICRASLFLANSGGTSRTTIFSQQNVGANKLTNAEVTAWSNTISGAAFTPQSGDYLVLEIGWVDQANSSLDSTIFTSGTTAITADGTSIASAQSFITSPSALTFSGQFQFVTRQANSYAQANFPSGALGSYTDTSTAEKGSSAKLLDLTTGSAQSTVTVNSIAASSTVLLAQFISLGLQAINIPAASWRVAFGLTASSASASYTGQVGIYLVNGGTGAIRTTLFTAAAVGGARSTSSEEAILGTVSGIAGTVTVNDYIAIELGANNGVGATANFTLSTDDATSIISDTAATSHAFAVVTCQYALQLNTISIIPATASSTSTATLTGTSTAAPTTTLYLRSIAVDTHVTKPSAIVGTWGHSTGFGVNTKGLSLTSGTSDGSASVSQLVTGNAEIQSFASNALDVQGAISNSFWTVGFVIGTGSGSDTWTGKVYVALMKNDGTLRTVIINAAGAPVSVGAGRAQTSAQELTCYSATIAGNTFTPQFGDYIYCETGVGFTTGNAITIYDVEFNNSTVISSDNVTNIHAKSFLTVPAALAFATYIIPATASSTSTATLTGTVSVPITPQQNYSRVTSTDTGQYPISNTGGHVAAYSTISGSGLWYLTYWDGTASDVHLAFVTSSDGRNWSAPSLFTGAGQGNNFNDPTGISLLADTSGNLWMTFAYQKDTFKASVQKYTGSSWFATAALTATPPSNIPGFALGAIYQSGVDTYVWIYGEYSKIVYGVKNVASGGSLVTAYNLSVTSPAASPTNQSASIEIVGSNFITFSVDGSATPKLITYQNAANSVPGSTQFPSATTRYTSAGALFREMCTCVDGSAVAHILYRDTHWFEATYDGTTWVTGTNISAIIGDSDLSPAIMWDGTNLQLFWAKFNGASDFGIGWATKVAGTWVANADIVTHNNQNRYYLTVSQKADPNGNVQLAWMEKGGGLNYIATSNVHLATGNFGTISSATLIGGLLSSLVPTAATTLSILSDSATLAGVLAPTAATSLSVLSDTASFVGVLIPTAAVSLSILSDTAKLAKSIAPTAAASLSVLSDPAILAEKIVPTSAASLSVLSDSATLAGVLAPTAATSLSVLSDTASFVGVLIPTAAVSLSILSDTATIRIPLVASATPSLTVLNATAGDEFVLVPTAATSLTVLSGDGIDVSELVPTAALTATVLDAESGGILVLVPDAVATSSVLSDTADLVFDIAPSAATILSVLGCDAVEVFQLVSSASATSSALNDVGLLVSVLIPTAFVASSELDSLVTLLFEVVPSATSSATVLSSLTAESLGLVPNASAVSTVLGSTSVEAFGLVPNASTSSSTLVSSATIRVPLVPSAGVSLSVLNTTVGTHFVLVPSARLNVSTLHSSATIRVPLVPSATATSSALNVFAIELLALIPTSGLITSALSDSEILVLGLTPVSRVTLSTLGLSASLAFKLVSTAGVTLSALGDSATVRISLDPSSLTTLSNLSSSATIAVDLIPNSAVSLSELSDLAVLAIDLVPSSAIALSELGSSATMALGLSPSSIASFSELDATAFETFIAVFDRLFGRNIDVSSKFRAATLDVSEEFKVGTLNVSGLAKERDL